MSGILGVFARGGALPENTAVHDMLDRMRVRGTERRAVWRSDVALLAVGRAEWELEPGFSGPILIGDDQELVIAADASLYHCADLLHRLRSAGVSPRSDHPSHLILAAYRAWGEECVAQLEGEWAFLLWDAARGQLLCSRQLLGSRPLYYAQLGGELVLASGLDVILALPGCPADLNLAAIGATAAGLFGADQETPYRAILRVPAGRTLRWQDGQLSVVHEWSPPQPLPDRRSDEEAAEELRDLLAAAVAQRMDEQRPSSVWLSGGHDSTAVFAVGASHAANVSTGGLTAVSVSYPPGDSGREDEIVRAVVEKWNRPVRWLDIRDIPFLERPADRAALREEPFAHAFEFWNRALALGSREAGVRVSFTGYGGDALFKTSPVYLADLLRAGALGQLRREWAARGRRGRGFRTFFRWAVQPLLSPLGLRAAALLRGGRPLRGYLDRVPPAWMNRGFLDRHGLLEKERLVLPAAAGRRCADKELLWYLLHPYAARVYGTVCGLALDAGIELRAPLLDDRVIAFVLSRPISDRAALGQRKRLLRHAVRDLLPEGIEAARQRNPGTTASYFDSSMRRAHAELLNQTFRSTALEDANIVNGAVLRDRTAEYLRTGRPDLGYYLFLTLQTELWLRFRSGSRGADPAVGGSAAPALLPNPA